MAISLFGGGAAQPADNTSDIIKNTTTATFVTDVIDASKKVPVIVDFWAPWCGPCKQLTPLLEKVVRASKGKVRLVKMNIDEHPEVAGQLQIQSIPAVFAFSQGQPVDGFMGALPESQVKAFVDRLTGPDADDLAGVEEAQRLFQEGDISGAAQLFGAVLKNDRENVDAIGGLAKCYIRLGDLGRAEQMLTLTPVAKQTAEAYLSAKAALELARKAEPSADTAALEKAIAANPRDWDARFKLAIVLVSKGKREVALDHLFEIVKQDRGWNDDAARKQLVELFEAWGPKDPLTRTGRQRLSSLLFA